MAGQDDNVSMEKVSFGSGDFADDLGNNDFGIQDTQLLASKDLQSFLLSDPDEVKDIKDDETETKNDQTQIQPKKELEQTSKDDIKKLPSKEKEKPEGKDALEDLLFGKEKQDEDGKQDNQNPGKPDDVIGEDDTYATLGKDLMRLGVFTKNSDDESEDSLDVKTPEQFLERFNLEKKKGAINILDSFLGQFGEDYRKMFDAVFVNGVKPQEYLTSFAKVEQMSQLNMEDESNQERILRSYYRGLKWDDQKIEGRIAKLKDYGDLEEEAKTFHEVLINKEKEQAATLEAQKKQEIEENKNKEIATKKSYQRILTDKLKAQELDGIPVTQKDVDETLSYLTDKKYKLASGELLSEFDKDLLEMNRPENHELKIKLGLLLRKKLDLTSVKKTTISKKSDQLFSLTAKNAKSSPKDREVKSFF